MVKIKPRWAYWEILVYTSIIYHGKLPFFFYKWELLQ